MKTHFISIMAVLCLFLETGTVADVAYTIGSNSITFTWKTNLFAADLEQANNIDGPWGYVYGYATPCAEWKYFEVPISTVDAEIDRAKDIAPGHGCTNNCGTNPFVSQKRFFRLVQKDNGLVPTPPFPIITHSGGSEYVCHRPIAWGCDDTLIDSCHFYYYKDSTGPIVFFGSAVGGGLTATNTLTNAGEYTFYAKAQDGTNFSYFSEASNPLTVP